VSAFERERDELKNGLATARMEKKISEQALEEKYKQQIEDRDDAIDRLKEMRARLSTKMDNGGLTSTARPSSTAFAPRPFRRRTSRKTTTRGRAARATTFSAE
jgi:adenine C2-methylase RlmN of 23S rRNA A2503 and tRNA A37